MSVNYKSQKPLPNWKDVAPTPWQVAESFGGKLFIYDANNKVVLKPTVSSTGKTPAQLESLYRQICKAMNALAVQEEDRGWKDFDAKVGIDRGHE